MKLIDSGASKCTAGRAIAIPTREHAETNISYRGLKETEQEKVLGLRWDTQTDEFDSMVGDKLIPQDILVGERTPTKMEFLRIVISIFDPLGLLAPLVVR